MKTPILGSSYVARSVNAADSRMVNLYPEAVPEGGKEPAFLSRCPGLKRKATIGTGPIRGLWQTKGIMYAVSGSTFYKVETYGRTRFKGTAIGTVTGTGPVSMVDNGTQIFIACNPDGFIYNTTTEVFQQITDPDFAGAVTVGYIDGYFVFNEPNTSRIWVTSLFDGLSVDPLDFASAEANPDNVLSLIVDHQETWLFGSNSIEVWYDAGLPDFPLQRQQGAVNEIGCAAAYSVAKLDNSVFWLGSDNRGRGIVYRANGYTGQRVSTHAVEWQIQQYGDISDAVAYSYQQDGHSFYVLTFPSAQATWVYDAATQAWHERAGWNNGEFVRHRSNCQVVYNNEIIVGDFENGNLYAFDLEDYTDNGDIQKWLRSWRALAAGQNNLKRAAHHTLQIDCETGVGTNTGQGSDPQIMLRWSDDGGHTWSNERWVSMGKVGEYFRRALFWRLGMTLKLRDRVYEISGTDPVKIAIMGAELYSTPTNA